MTNSMALNNKCITMNVNKSIFQDQADGRYLALLVYKFTVSYSLAFPDIVLSI